MPARRTLGNVSRVVNLPKAWFEDIGAGCVTSVSFAAEPSSRCQDESSSAFWVPNFVVGTSRAYVVACTASAFDELDPENRYCSVNAQTEEGTQAVDLFHIRELSIVRDVRDVVHYLFFLRVVRSELRQILDTR